MTMTGSRPWVIGGMMLAVVAVVLTWLVVISPTRADAQGLRDDTTAVQTQNDVLRAKNAALAEQAERREELEATTRAALAALPPDLALPDFNQELAQHATARGVKITSIGVGAATATDGAAPDGSGVAPQTGTLSVPITIETSGPPLAQLYFLRDLQEVGPRAALVTSTSLTTEAAASSAPDAAPVDPAAPAEPSTTTTKLTTLLTVFSASLSETDEALLDEVLGTVSTD